MRQVIKRGFMKEINFDDFINVDKLFGKILICGLEGFGKTLLLSAIAVKVMLNGLNDTFRSYEKVDEYNKLGFNFSKNYEHLCFSAFIEINCAGTNIPDRVSYDFDPFHFGLFCSDGYETDIYPPYSSLFVPECQRVWPSYKAEQIRPEVYGKMETGRQSKFNLICDAQRLMMVAKPIRDLFNRIIILENKVEEIKDLKGNVVGHKLHILEFSSNADAEKYVNNRQERNLNRYILKINKCMYENFLTDYFEFMSLIGRESQDFRIVEHKKVDSIDDINSMTSILMPDDYLVSNKKKIKEESVVNDNINIDYGF